MDELQELIEKHHNDKRVPYDQIKQLLDNADIEEHIFWNKELIVSYQLENGFTIAGRGAVIDPDNFNLEIGRKVARQDAERQLWQLEGYRLQWQLYEEGLL